MQTKRRAACKPAWAQEVPCSSPPHGRMQWSHRRMQQWLEATSCTPLISGEMVARKVYCDHVIKCSDLR